VMDVIGDLKRGGAHDPQVSALKARVLLLEDERHDLIAEVRRLKNLLEKRRCARTKPGQDCACPHCGGIVYPPGGKRR